MDGENKVEIDPGDPPQMSPEEVAAIQSAIAQAEVSAQAEEMAAYEAMRAGGMDPRVQGEGVSILDDAAQALVDTRVLDGLIRNFREGLANAKMQWFLSSRGMMPKDSRIHPETMKAEVRRHEEAIKVLTDIAREMEQAEGEMAFPGPSGLEIASVSLERK